MDGFSGPWKSRGRSARRHLLHDRDQEAAAGSRRSGRRPAGRRRSAACLSKESQDAIGLFEAAVREITDIQIETLNGDFEHSIPEVLRFIGKAFSLVFIDPTGWTGFGLKQIALSSSASPWRGVGQLHVRLREPLSSTILGQISPRHSLSYFGGPAGKTAVHSAVRREDAVVELYRERMRAAGRFAHVTSTRILKPTHDRSYFYLVYGTRHFKGLIEFREVERKAVDEQERVRFVAKQESREARTGQTDCSMQTTLRSCPHRLTWSAASRES